MGLRVAWGQADPCWAQLKNLASVCGLPGFGLRLQAGLIPASQVFLLEFRETLLVDPLGHDKASQTRPLLISHLVKAVMLLSSTSMGQESAYRSYGRGKEMSVY